MSEYAQVVAATLQTSGVWLVLVTGRPARCVREFAPAWRWDSIVICCNGAVS